MTEYIHRATKKHLQCRLNRHLFEEVTIYEYSWNGSYSLFGVDLLCDRCGVEAFDVIGEHGEKIGARKYNYETTNRYKVEPGEIAPTMDDVRQTLIVFAKAKRKRTSNLPEWKQKRLKLAENKV